MGRKVTVAGQVVGRCVVASWLQEARQGVHVRGSGNYKPSFAIPLSLCQGCHQREATS